MSEFDDSSKSNGHIGSWNIGTFIRMKPPPRNKAKKLIGLRNHGKHKNTSCSCNALKCHFVLFSVVSTEVGVTRSVLEIDIPPDADPGLVHNNESGRVHFEFDRVFGATENQEEIFNQIAYDKVMGALDGINSTIFACKIGLISFSLFVSIPF
jgi:hypothetical protein